MSEKFTPGEMDWCVNVWPSGRLSISSLVPGTYHSVDIAEVWPNHITPQRQIADMLAAAPKFYRALERVLLWGRQMGYENRPEFAEAKAALAAARGEE